MATRAAIAAKDRKTKEDIGNKDRHEGKRQFEKTHRFKEKMGIYEGIDKSAKATKNLVGAASTLGAMMNDPSWYKKNNLSNFATNLPTFYRLGMQLVDKWLRLDYDDAVAGIAVINYLPTLPNQCPSNVTGNTYYKNSPINQVLVRFMAELRKLNSRIGDYDPSDIGLYWYAMDGLMTKICNLVKAIKGYNTYYASNRYLSKAFIKSCGFDPDDFVANIAEYKALAIKAISIFNANSVIPKGLDFMSRAYWLASVVIREHKTDCSQIYHFNMPFSVRLDDDEEYVAITALGGDALFAAFKLDLEAKMQNLFSSTGIVTMTADLRAAFPESTLLKLPEFTGSETLQYSESIHDLEQVHNMRTLPMSANNENFGDDKSSVNNTDVVSRISRANIVVDADGYLGQGAISGGNLYPLVYTAQFNANTLPYISTIGNVDNNFLNFYDSEYVSDDAVLEGSRLRCILHQFNADWNGHAIKVCGTEIALDIVLLVTRTDADSSDLFEVVTDYDMATNIVLNSPIWCSALSHVTSFDWFPWIKFYGSDDEDFQYTFGEIDHAVAIKNDNLKLLHEGCAYSLFYVDSFSKAHVA